MFPLNVVAAAGGVPAPPLGGYQMVVGDIGLGDFGYSRIPLVGALDPDDLEVLATGALVDRLSQNNGGNIMQLTLGGSVPNNDTQFRNMIILNGPAAGTYARSAATFNAGPSSSWEWAAVPDFVDTEIYNFEFEL